MKIKTKVSSIALALLLLGGTDVTVHATSKVNLSDINGHWAESQIKDFISKGYLNGYEDGTFKPNNSITRGEFVKIFNTVFGLTKSSGITFTDVPDGYWAKNEIDIAVTNGVCQGVSSTEFAPNTPITREQAAKMIANYKKISDTNHDKLNKYLDSNTVSSWALDSVESVIEAGYMVGSEGKFNPKKNITRAEAVVTLGRANGVFDTIAQPEAEDNMKLPTINFAKEGNMLMTGRGGYDRPSWNKIEGNLYVKYGNPNTRPHSYGSANQSQYDYVVTFVKDKLKTINFRHSVEWVYLQHFLNNGKQNLDDNYIDPILAKNGTDVRYKTWRTDFNYVIIGLQKGIMTVEDAEKLMVYNAVVGHVRRGLTYTDDGTGSAYSAYDVLYHKKGDCDANAQLDLIVADIVGLSGMIGGSSTHQEVMVKVGNYWWNNGIKPTLNATDNIFQKLSVVSEAPTY